MSAMEDIQPDGKHVTRFYPQQPSKFRPNTFLRVVFKKRDHTPTAPNEPVASLLQEGDVQAATADQAQVGLYPHPAPGITAGQYTERYRSYLVYERLSTGGSRPHPGPLRNDKMQNHLALVNKVSSRAGVGRMNPQTYQLQTSFQTQQQKFEDHKNDTSHILAAINNRIQLVENNVQSLENNVSSGVTALNNRLDDETAALNSTINTMFNPLLGTVLEVASENRGTFHGNGRLIVSQGESQFLFELRKAFQHSLQAQEAEKANWARRSAETNNSIAELKEQFAAFKAERAKEQDSLNTANQALESRLTTVQNELNTTKTQLSTVKTELSTTKSQLSTVQTELYTTRRRRYPMHQANARQLIIKKGSSKKARSIQGVYSGGLKSSKNTRNQMGLNMPEQYTATSELDRYASAWDQKMLKELTGLPPKYLPFIKNTKLTAVRNELAHDNLTELAETLMSAGFEEDRAFMEPIFYCLYEKGVEEYLADIMKQAEDLLRVD